VVSGPPDHHSPLTYSWYHSEMAEVNPLSELAARESDVALPTELFLKLPPFSLLKSPPSLEKFPGSVRLRHYRPGEVVCSQGEAGWTAFFILSDDDGQKLRSLVGERLKVQQEAAAAAKAKLDQGRALAEGELAQLRLELVTREAEAAIWKNVRDQLPDAMPAGMSAGEDRSVMARVYLALPRRSARSGLLRSLRGGAGRSRPQGGGGGYIPNDGPIDLDHEKAEASLHAGEFVGEMSCLYRTRRSATVVAARDCYLVEMLRNILDKLFKDAGYKARMDEIYRRRVLSLHLREFPLFHDLEDEHIRLVQEQAELADFPPGALIFDEHDRADNLYLIRSGTVRVLKNTSFLIRGEEFVDLAALSSELRTPLRPPSSLSAGEKTSEPQRFPEARQYICSLLSEDVRRQIEAAGAAGATAPAAAALATALNQILKQPRLHEAAQIRTALRERSLPKRIWEFLSAPERRGERELSRFNRAILNVLYGNPVPAAPDAPESEPLLRPRDILDWKALGTALLWEEKPDSKLQRLVYQSLAPEVQSLLERGKWGDTLEQGERRQVLDAVNAIIQGPPLGEDAAAQAFSKTKPNLTKGLEKLRAAFAKNGEELRRRANRLFLGALYRAGTIPEDEGLLSSGQVSALLKLEDFSNWRDLCAALAGAGDPRRLVWNLLPAPVQAHVRAAKLGQTLDVAARQQILEAINELLRFEPLLLFADFQDYLTDNPPFCEKLLNKVRDFLPNRRKWTEQDFYRFNRGLNRLFLEGLCPRGLRRYGRGPGAARVLAYCGQGEIIGEMALVRDEPLHATCVAYNHPELDPALEVGPVQLLRIGRALVDRLRKESKTFDREIKQIVEQRTAKREAPHTQPGPVSLLSPRAAEPGLPEGQQLMLIDLDRCTRCDECVNACVRTHDDGRSRLFLDGPRFGKYLVPMTCRSCLDPVCMIGCPVGSIHRGNNGQIIIEDWCIGCEQCAQQCPYGSIQMHDIGVIPQVARGWRCLPTGALASGKEWYLPSSKDDHWLEAASPFYLDRQFRTDLEGHLREHKLGLHLARSDSFCFRYSFRLSREQARSGSQFQLQVTAPDPKAAPVWINGKSLSTDSRPRQGRLEYTVGGPSASAGKEAPPPVLGSGWNLLAIQVQGRPAADAPLLSVRMDEMLRPEGLGKEVTQKVVAARAVVCDLCSDLGTPDPACVKACPHDAAMRLNAGKAFPPS